MTINLPTLLTTRAGQTLTPPLLSPVRLEQKVLIPSGTRTWFRGAVRVTKRAQTITVFSTSPGYLSQVDHKPDLQTVKPWISWPGSGGYWVDCDLTDAIFEANGFVQEVNVKSLAGWKYHLEQVTD
jgi:hypothetical protein